MGNDVNDFIGYLNSLLILDSKSISELFSHRINCNSELANHETVQVLANDTHGYKIGILGILNGYFGIIKDGPKAGFGYITAVYDNDSELVKFQSTIPQNNGD